MNSLDQIQNLEPNMRQFIANMLAMVNESFPQAQEIAPMIAVLRGDGELGVIPLEGLPKGAANRAINTLRNEAPLVFICEAWTSRISTKPDSAIAAAVRAGDMAVIPEPRLQPDRKEAVMVQYFHHARRIMASAAITRPNTGPAVLEPWQFTDCNAGEFYSTSFGPSDARLTSGIVKP